MKGVLRRGLVALLGAALALPAITGSAYASSVTSSDPTGTTIDPRLVRAEAMVNNPLFQGAPWRTTELNSFNITEFTLNATGSAFIGTIKTASAIPRCDLDGNQSACSPLNNKGFGGGRVMILFQTPQMEQFSEVGCADAACTGQSVWNPIRATDSHYLLMDYGVTVSEQQVTYGLATYDPAGRVAAGAPLEPGAGQVFGVLGEPDVSEVCNAATIAALGPTVAGDLPVGVGNNASIAVSGNTVTLTIPYEYKWRTKACLGRQKTIAVPGSTFSNAVAFAWAEDEIGGPGIGLILGWTEYFDSVPALGSSSGGYKIGTPAGDPNPSTFAGPNCPFYTRSVTGVNINNPTLGINHTQPLPIPVGHVKNPLDNGAKCMINNQTGPGFPGTGGALSGTT